MNIKKNLGILLKSPKRVLMSGLIANNEAYYKKLLEDEYGISKLPSINILDLVPDMDDTIDVYSFLSGTSLITDLILLKSLAKKLNNPEYMEIGSWRGESLRAVCDDVKHCTSVSLSEKELRGMNASENFIKSIGYFSKDIPNLTNIEANSHEFDFSSLNKQFDLIFIDGDHSYEGVLNDTRKTFGLRKDKNSIIVWHDYSYLIDDVRYTTLKAILDGVPKEKHKNLYHVSNTLCAVYIEDADFKTKATEMQEVPDKVFSVNLKGKKL